MTLHVQVAAHLLLATHLCFSFSRETSKRALCSLGFLFYFLISALSSQGKSEIPDHLSLFFTFHKIEQLGLTVPAFFTCSLSTVLWALNTLHTVFYQPAQLTCSSWRTGPGEADVLRNCLRSLCGLLHIFIPHKPPYSKGSAGWFLASYLSKRKANSLTEVLQRCMKTTYSLMWMSEPNNHSDYYWTRVLTMETGIAVAIIQLSSNTCFVACRLLFALPRVCIIINCHQLIHLFIQYI